MRPQRSDSVFLLTLVDFLIQIIFFGLFVFIVFQVMMQREQKLLDRAKVESAIQEAGVSNLTELVDELSKLAPVRLKGFNETLGNESDASELKAAAEAIRDAGGAAGLSDSMERLAKLERGSGLPPCLEERVEGAKRAKPLASATGTAGAISFDAETPELKKLLSEVGLSYGAVRSLSLRQFPRVFQRVLQKYPNCRFTITFRETTRMVDARDAAGQIFYLRLRR